MVDAYTTTASSGLDTAAYNAAIDYALRHTLHYVPVATVRPTNQTHKGTSVTFFLENDLAIASAPLNESVDVDAVAMSDSTVVITLAEHGNALITTAKLEATAMINIDPVKMNVIARNAAISMDELALIQLAGGSNVSYATGGASTPADRVSVAAEDVIAADDVRRAVAQLKMAAVESFNGYYVGFISPDVVYDLQGDTGATGWLQPANYSAAERRWSGEIGRFAGVAFVEASRTRTFVDGGATNTDVYATIIVGRDALAHAFGTGGGYRGQSATFVAGAVTDKLARFHPLGWKWFGAFGRYREAAIRRLESSSSIGA